MEIAIKGKGKMSLPCLQNLFAGDILNSILKDLWVVKNSGGGEIAQSLASLSTKWAIQVRARLDLLVLERWNSIAVLLTRSHQCRRLVKKKAVHVLLCLCNNACKRSLAICRKSKAMCPVSRLLSVPI